MQVLDQGPGTAAHPKVNGTTLQGNVSDIGLGTAGNANNQGLGAFAENILQTAPKIPYPEPKNVGSGTFRAWLQKTHPGLPQNSKDSIVEVKGQWDDSGHILHALGLSYTRVSPAALLKTNLRNTAVIVVDCAGNLNQDSLDLVRNFVLNGGYLVTTDWALDNCLTRITSYNSPGFLEWNGGYSYADIVDAVVVDPVPELTAGCVPYARWKLDDKCQTVRVRHKALVHVLVRSKMLAARGDPDNLGILAATFDFGRGKVLHVVGHCDNNSTGAFNTQLPDPAPSMGISLRQGLIANFIVEGLKAHPQPGANVAAQQNTPSNAGLH